MVSLIMCRLVLILSILLVFPLCLPAAHAAEFKDYDFTQYSQKITRCDRYASHGRDPGHVAPPVSQRDMNNKKAIAACLSALKKDPDNPRLNYQLGRAYGYSGQGEKAMPYRLKAVEADYPQSLFVIGYLYLTGRTIEKDACKTFELWQRGAQYKRLAALIALPRHYMRGDFEECEASLSHVDMQAYLEQAKSQSSDYYVGMLVEELLQDLGTNHDAITR